MTACGNLVLSFLVRANENHELDSITGFNAIDISLAL